MAETFDELTQKKCRRCISCGKPENDGLLSSDDPWICNECREIFGKLRGVYLRRGRQKAKYQEIKYGVNQERGRLLLESWFCNFCPNKGQLCQESLKSIRQCIVGKVKKVTKYYASKEHPSHPYVFVHQPKINQIKEQRACDRCGRTFEVGALMSDADVNCFESKPFANIVRITTHYSFCPTCLRIMEKQLEREERERIETQAALECNIEGQIEDNSDRP